ncbi:suppressor protein SRP40-like, partial [Trifolium medium]|nr:suppressor protein SRP40-like [Trifolium medium]
QPNRKAQCAFEGNSEEHKEDDAVLFFDGETLRLELLHKVVEQLQHIQMPGESSTVAASSPIRKSAKRAPFDSARSAFEAALPLSASACQLFLSS